MEAGFVIAIALALAFAATNGIHDASNAIATLVATRAARPLQAIVLASVFNLLGPLLVGAAVADTIGGIVTVDPSVAAAEATIEVQHRIGDAYYRGMAGLLEERDMRSRIKLRELYRRCARIGEVIMDVAERVMYAIVKQS